MAGADKFDDMKNDVKADLLRRTAQYLKDAKALLYSWQSKVEACADCKSLVSETAPFMKGLNGLLKEYGEG